MDSLVNKLIAVEIEECIDKHPDRKTMVLNSQYECLFLSITKLAATISNAPLAMIHFLNDQHIWMEPGAKCSDIVQHTQKEIFFNWAMANDQYIEIPDGSSVPNKSAQSFNKNYPNIKFYAGVPLKLPLGEVMGVLSVFDTKPNRMNQSQKCVLLSLADVISKSLLFKRHISTNWP